MSATIASEAPEVSIALSMHNAAGTIERALRSVLWQTFTSWELILLDDGSTDDSRARVRRIGDPRVRLVEGDRRCGLAVRLNQAVDRARGRYFARMDADDIAYPERLARQVAYLDSHPQVDLLGTGMTVFDASGAAVGLFPVRCDHEAICARPYWGFYLAHPTWMGRIEWFRRWRYDPACRKAQDQDLLLRAYRSSRFAVLQSPLVGYRQERISLKKSLLGRWWFSRGIWRAARRDGRMPQGIGAIALHGARLLYDAMAVGSGLQRVMLPHRAGAMPAEEVARWREVWAHSDIG